MHNMKRPELRQIGADLSLAPVVLNANKGQLVDKIMGKIFSSPHFLSRFDVSAFDFCPLLKKPLAEAYKKFINANPSYSLMDTPGMFPHSMLTPQQQMFRTTTSNYQGDMTTANTTNSGQPQTPYGFNAGCSQQSNLCLNPWMQCKWNGKQGGVQIACKAQGCNRKFHAECLKIHECCVEKEARTFECPYCVLGKNDPLSEISHVLLEPFIVVNGEQKQFIIDQMRLQQIKEDPSMGIEVRCLKLDYKYLNEQTWLDSGELYLNMRRVCEFKPLQMNSALKKRKDEKFFYREHLLVINSIKFQDIKPNYEQKPNVRYDENAIYMAGVFLVRKLRAEELITKIQSTCVKDVLTCKSSIFNELENNSFVLEECKISIDKVSLSLSDAFDKQTIKTPARTVFCTHLQCFSLENLVKVMENTVPKKWRCPICKVKAFDLVIDGYIWEIIQGISKKELVSEIIFLRNGTYELKKAKDEENNEN
ncbi:hypothetical protein KC799_27820, partial [candidate division KSB1 bacterium]|nr:hypothetical protein [candidate division KSB1 bacterium]